MEKLLLNLNHSNSFLPDGGWKLLNEDIQAWQSDFVFVTNAKPWWQLETKTLGPSRMPVKGRQSITRAAPLNVSCLGNRCRNAGFGRWLSSPGAVYQRPRTVACHPMEPHCSTGALTATVQTNWGWRPILKKEKNKNKRPPWWCWWSNSL